MLVAGTPLGRLGQPWEIAAACLFLASPASGFTTGQVLSVDGGIQGTNFDLGIPDV